MSLTWLHHYDNQETQLKELLLSWALINSGTMNIPGLEKQADAIDSFFSDISETSERHSLPPYTRVDDAGQLSEQSAGPLLIYRMRPHARKQVLLSGHMDTVFAETDSFQTPRWVDDNTLEGPGVADMKGGLLVIGMALRLFEGSPNRSELGWTVIINSDEEIGSLSSKAFLQEACQGKDLGLVYEPSANPAGAYAGERKGSGKLTLVVRGKAAHAGRNFHEGRNAILYLSKIIQAMDALNGQQPTLTINVGVMRGGQVVNQVPDCAMARIDIRYGTEPEKNWLMAELEKIEKNYSQADFSWVTYPQFTRPPKPMNAAQQHVFHFLRETAQKLGQTVEWIPSGGVCDGNLLSEAGLANIDTLGVIGGHLHTHKEYMFWDSLMPRAKLSAYLLARLAAGEWEG